MDPSSPRGRKRPSPWLSVCFILIYQAHLSWGVDRVNLSDWKEFNNSDSSRIKQQKWDTASQGGQDLQMAAAAVETSSSSSRTEASNLRSSSTERTPASSWAVSSDQSSAPPRQTASRTVSSSQSPGTTTQTSQSPGTTTQTSQSPGTTTQTSQSPGTTTQTSQSPGTTTQTSQSPGTTTQTSQSPGTTTQTSQSPAGTTQTSQSPGTTTQTSQSPGTTTQTSQSPGTTTQTSQSPAGTTQTSQSPGTTTQTSQSPAGTTQTSQSPGTTTQTSQSPAGKTQTSQSPAGTTQTSQSPGTTTQTSQSPAGTTQTSQSPAGTTQTSQSPGGTTQTSQSPAGTTQTSQSPGTTTQTSQSPAGKTQTSQSPAGTTQTSQSPGTTTQTSQSPAGTTQTSQSPGTTTQTSQSPAGTTQTSQSPAGTTQTSQSPTISAGKSLSGTTTASQTPPNTAPASQTPPKKAPASHSPTSTTKSSQSPTNPVPVRNAPAKIASDHSAGKTTKPSQSSSSQTPLNQSTTGPKTTNQSSFTLTSNQSPTSLTGANQSRNGWKTPHHDQSQTSSVSSNQSPSGSPGNAVRGDERPANFSLLARQVKEALRSSFRRIQEPCALPCLNGGQCAAGESCDCSLYQATGHRCQTVPNPGFEREMTCRSWGQYNFETFDGLYYHFPGRCSYTLLRDCEETTQAGLVVQVHNDPDCRSAPYTCHRSVSLFLPWDGELRLHANNVTFEGQSLQLPRHIHDLQLERISQYVLVTQQRGFTLAWDGRGGSVYIKLSPEFVGRTCGLCGNFNADVQDDLKTSYGVLTHDVEMFGNSWVAAEPHEARCPMVHSGFSSPCAAVEAHVLLEVEDVCATLLEPPFQSCHDLVSPLSYMASCSNDLCMSGPSGDAVCQVFSEYARACAHAGHPLHDWRRHIPQCAKQCPPGLQHRECISCCPASCNLERTCIDSKLACLDGCYCPDGLIYEDGGCVTPSDCPCEHRGLFYPSGRTLQEECSSCTCEGGVWNCTDYSCPGECSVTGDMYFHSFDGRRYTFSATCQYVLAKSRNSGKFTVTVQNAPCGANLDGACIQSVSLVIDEDPRTEITLSHVGEVFMAGHYRISLPYSDDVFHIQELSSSFLQVKTAFGLRLQYSWREFRLYLQADELWRDGTAGLCGTFNGNIQDDFLSPSGMIESTPQLFGNAWRVSSACSTSLSASPLDPCDTHQQAAAYASEMCDVLNQDLFSGCHEYLSPTSFHQQCRSDTCKCGAPCLCSALAHYARHCRRFNVVVDFRSQIPDCAAACPATMRYGTCVSSCQRRCSALSVPQHCGEECEEGCVCPPETFYNHRTHTCVHRSECPCSFLGADYEPGDVIMTSAGVQLCLDGKLASQTSDSDMLCPAGQRYQNCSEGGDGFLSGRGVACEHTCESFLLNLTCSSHEPCVTGCICPPGSLKHGDECFEPASCPCLWKGKEYYPGDRVSSPCHQCVCQQGAFHCVFRPCPSTCTAYGDRHYRTFDGLPFDYVGGCRVYLVKSSGDELLSVTAENVDCFHSGVTCRKSLLINIGRSSVAFDEDSGKPNPSSVLDGKQRMFIWPAGYFTVVHFPDDDVTVLWDRKTTVHVQVGPRWQGKLSGLCGNFDAKTVNEMRTPDNVESPTPQEFGNSWTAAECVNSPDIRHPCSLSPLREPFAKRQCGVLLSEVFQACHPVVDVTWFYMNCLADTCACSRGGDCECFCTSVAAYAQRCCHHGVPVDWRSPSLCPYDCEFYNKVLGKGPFRLVTFRDRAALLAASGSSGAVFMQRGNFSAAAAAGVLSQFMVTPGLSRARPHVPSSSSSPFFLSTDTSRVSFEAADRPNYFLSASPGGQVRLAKWEESDAFWDGATFVLHRNTWTPGYDALESHARPGFFLHATPLRLHLLKYRHADSFRKATLFRLTGPSADALPGPRCQWRYDSCVVPCFKTCSDPSAEACVAIPQVEGCLPVCPPHMVLDEVTRRCVFAEDCIKGPVAVQPVTPSSASETYATTTSSAASTSPLQTTSTTASSTLPLTIPTSETTTTSPVVSTSSEAPPAPEELTHPVAASTSAAAEPSRTSGHPSPPTAPPAVRPEVEESLSTVRETEASAAASTTTRAASSTAASFGPITSRTSSAPSAVTSLFWATSSVKPTDLLPPLSSTSAATTLQTPTAAAPTASSVQGPTSIGTPPPVVVHPTTETTEATTHPAAVAPVVTASSPSPAPVSETAPVTDRTTVPSTVVITDTSTKPVTVEQLPLTPPTITTTTPIPSGLPSLASVTSSPLPISPPVETGTTSLPTVTSAKTTEPVTPVAPFSTSKTPPYVSPETTSPAAATEKILHTTPTELRTSTTAVPETPTSSPFHVAPTTTAPSAPSSAATDWRTTTRKVTILESTVSDIPGASTTTAAPPLTKITDIPTSPASTTTTYADRTSWSTAAPTAEKTTLTTTSRPPEMSTVSTGPPVTTKPTVPPMPPTETTAGPRLPAADSSTHPASTVRTSEPWHRDTSSASLYTGKTLPEVTSKTVILEVTSTKTTEAPLLPVTSTPFVTSATSAPAAVTRTKTTTLPEISTAEIAVTTSRIDLATPSPPPAPGVPETHPTTSSTRAPPGVVTTTLRPVTLQPTTETTQPATGGAEVTTRATTTPPPSWSPAHTTTTSSAVTRPTTVQDVVTTRSVSTERSTPATMSTTIARMTDVRSTPRVPVTTGVTPTITSTEGSTVRPVTERVTIVTRPPASTTSSTTLGPPTAPSSPASTTTSGKPSASVSTSAGSVATATTAPPPGLATASAPPPVAPPPGLATASAPPPVPTLARVTVSSVTPTTTRESAAPEETSTTKESDAPSPPDTHLTSTQKPAVPTTTPLPAAASVQTTEQDRVHRTSPGATPPPAMETTRHAAEVTTSMSVWPTRPCTPPYAEIVDECTKYICVSNQLVLFNKSQSCPFAAERPNCGLLGFAVLVNGDKCCPKWECPCRCSMFPDLNVITFDGNSVAVYKAASYIVSRLPNETVSVLVQECPADSESALLWNFTNLCLVALNITHHSHHVIVNRLQRRLYVDSRYAKPRFKKFGFEIYDTGNMYLIRSPAGLKLQWYHSTGMMVIDTGGSGNKLRTTGLCGFCDGDPTNDLTLANGTTLGAGEDPDAFIDSWQVPNTTGYVSHSRRRELNCSTSDCSGCLLMLQSDAFHRCHAFVPPSTFCEVWVRDAEYVNNQCVALAAYVASCHKFNVCIEWRRPDYCPFSCPGALRYRACLPACTSQSCPNQDFDSDPDPDQCSGLTEGCECSEGTLLHRPYSALCISPDKCACTDSAGVPRAHGEVWKASKDACCVYRCDHNDAVVPVEHDCSGAAPPPVCRRAAEVLISLADAAGGCCPQEVCVCNQSLCDLIPPDCKYGEKLASYYRQDSCCPDYVCECDPELCEPDALACRDDHTLIATRADGSCCPAFICMCSSCPETPPLCQDGEVLTVDPNTTDRCCPAYQCVCEPYRCPLLVCAIGMSVASVSSPGRCCQNQTCECSCEKISSPKCGLGEAAQLDRAFLSDPQNQCACKRFKCVREAVCVFGERGVLRPGQTLVEHHGDGVCLSRQCSRSIDPTSGFNLLRSDSINCSAHCQPNQVYVPPKDQTTCCGVCKNVSCLYEHENGTTLLYKPGKSWVSNCVKFDCRDTRSGPTLISYSYSCPPFNETECMKIGGTVVSYMDECCKTCKEDGKSCQKVTVRMTIRKNDCRSNRPVNIVSCDGKCPSASIYNYNINTYARFCKCCRETGLQRRSVQLYCSGNATWVSYGIQEPTDCSCQWS
ncbi:otogelin [Cyclopterus lumpus]|uniref:otogelin n=1 Tax=Cyclopterus lumpus TaxID=8103 RepID=UPI0014869A9A|nr:otogelin [Cyclopterus lumpus]